MRAAATAELYVRATPERAAAAVDAVVPPGIRFTRVRTWEPVRWGAGLVAWRWTGRWRRQRGEGEVTVDVVPAGPHHTLVSLLLRPPTRWFVRPPGDADAHHILSSLRDVAEQRGGVTPLPASRRPLSPHTPSVESPAPTAALAVGYSDP